MALKPDRITIDEDISFFNNDTTSVLNASKAERGGILCYSTAGSGAAMDDSAAVVTYAATPSGNVPAGVLMQDMVNLDLTRQHKNFYGDENQTGGKCNTLVKGTIVTNFIYPGQTPTVGQIAYVAHSGYFASTDVIVDDSANGAAVNRQVGRFTSIKNEDGYAKISVNLPN